MAAKKPFYYKPACIKYFIINLLVLLTPIFFSPTVHAQQLRGPKQPTGQKTKKHKARELWAFMLSGQHFTKKKVKDNFGESINMICMIIVSGHYWPEFNQH